MNPVLLPALLLAVAPPQQAPTGQSAPAELSDPLTDPAAAPSPATVPGAAPPAPARPRRHPRHAPGDPLEGFNRRMFGLNQTLDRHVFRPAALGYRHVVPKPLRSGIRNFFSNLGEPIVFLNDVLQLKPKRAARTFVRFVINTGVGIGGLFDIAKRKGVDLPHHANSLGDTLALWGVRSGPYLFLPLVGPSDLRDFAGGQVDGLVLPTVVGHPFDRTAYRLTKTVLTGLDQRAEADADLRALFAGAVDPYATLRSVYLQSRQGEIDGLRRHHKQKTQGAASELDTPLADPADTEAKPDEAAGAAAGTEPPAPSTTPELSDPLTDPAASPPPPAPQP